MCKLHYGIGAARFLYTSVHRTNALYYHIPVPQTTKTTTESFSLQFALFRYTAFLKLPFSLDPVSWSLPVVPLLLRQYPTDRRLHCPATPSTAILRQPTAPSTQPHGRAQVLASSHLLSSHFNQIQSSIYKRLSRRLLKQQNRVSYFNKKIYSNTKTLKHPCV